MRKIININDHEIVIEDLKAIEHLSFIYWLVKLVSNKDNAGIITADNLKLLVNSVLEVNANENNDKAKQVSTEINNNLWESLLELVNNFINNVDVDDLENIVSKILTKTYISNNKLTIDNIDNYINNPKQLFSLLYNILSIRLGIIFDKKKE